MAHRFGKLGLPMALAFAIAWPACRANDGAREAPQASVARGARLFDGTEALAGTLSGHSTPLPVEATRCIQCHSGPGKSTAVTSDFAPPLGRRQLREARARRGGPPIAYEQASFCRTLRTGVDPGHIVLPRAMPRFDADDAQCAALWDYLTQGPDE
ncbi:MAG TPA: hypothetical protein VJ832_19535 [Variovorax sp.]|nr:hypothetical protein [Variovorax sp.]